MKPKLLVVELWGLGNLVIATPLLRAAAEHFDITLLAKPYALDLQRRLWPGVRVVPFVAPWTAFKNKYRLWQWPWREIIKLRNRMAGEHFDYGISARRITSPPLSGDLRDHLLLKLFGVQHRIGFPFLRRRFFLTQAVVHPEPEAHRYESWRAVARALQLELPPREKIFIPAAPRRETVLIHSGAGQPVRVWPLENYRRLAARLREKKIPAQIACDPDQRGWWLKAGETRMATPATVAELIALIDRAGAFIGNDSGRATSRRSAACPPSPSSARNCRNGLRRSIRRRSGWKAGSVLTCRARITAGIRRRTVCGTSVKRKSGRAWKNSPLRICKIISDYSRFHQTAVGFGTSKRTRRSGLCRV